MPSNRNLVLITVFAHRSFVSGRVLWDLNRCSPISEAEDRLSDFSSVAYSSLFLALRDKRNSPIPVFKSHGKHDRHDFYFPYGLDLHLQRIRVVE